VHRGNVSRTPFLKYPRENEEIAVLRIRDVYLGILIFTHPGSKKKQQQKRGVKN
jgi:hypothetical protein